MNDLPEHCCTCGFCVETRRMAVEWAKFEVKTALQKRMKDVVADIENNLVKDKENVYTKKFNT
jgi:hypothetical protein